MKKISIEINEDVAKEILDAAMDYRDEGPESEGWRSDELVAACKSFEQAIHKASSKYPLNMDDPQTMLSLSAIRAGIGQNKFTLIEG